MPSPNHPPPPRAVLRGRPAGHRPFQLVLPLHGGGGARAVARGRPEHCRPRRRGRLSARVAAFDYHRPLRFEDEFDVHIRIVAMTTRRCGMPACSRRATTKIATGTLDDRLRAHAAGDGDEGASASARDCRAVRGRGGARTRRCCEVEHLDRESPGASVRGSASRSC